MLTQRDWDIAQLESQMRVQSWFQEWMDALLRGRNPLDKLSNMTPDDAVTLRNAEPPTVLPQTEEE